MEQFMIRRNTLHKFNNITRPALCITMLLVFVFGCSSKSSGLNKYDIKPLVNAFLRAHASYGEFDNAISERTLDNIIYQLDPAKYYFYKKDIDGFLTHKDKIDDYVEEGNYEFLFQIFKVYRTRFEERQAAVKILAAKAKDIDFSKDETINLDRDKMKFAENSAEMTERWRKKIKLELLNYLSGRNNIEDAQEKLLKRYSLLEKRIREIDKDRMYAMFLNSFSTALDPHSNYLTKEDHEDFMIQTNLKLEGIGVMLRSEEGFVLVERVIPGGAADKLPESFQLKPNDKIIAVAQSEGEPVEVIDMDLRDVVKLIRGKKGTEVRLTVLRDIANQKQERLIIPITREVIKLEEQAARSELVTVNRNSRKTKIGYLKLPSFYLDFDAAARFDPDTRSSYRDVKTELAKLKKQGMDALVIDLRGNPGGALEEAINIAGLFIKSGPILQIKGTDRWGNRNTISVIRDKDPGEFWQGPVVVLIDKFSASASEILAGAIKDYNRGLILGPSSSFGKGTVQSYAKLMEGRKGAMKVTTGVFYQPAGESNHLFGIRPHVLVPDMSVIWDIGEDKLRYPLKWEKIKSAKFKAYRQFMNRRTAEILQRKSRTRIQSSERYRTLVAKIKKLKAQLGDKVVSLREESKKENTEIKEIEKKMRNKRKKVADLENDLFLNEAINVTADYVQIIGAVK